MHLGCRVSPASPIEAEHGVERSDPGPLPPRQVSCRADPWLSQPGL